MHRLLINRRWIVIGEEGQVGTDPGSEADPRAKSNHQRGYRCRNTIISIVATNRPAPIPPPVLVTLDTVSPVSVTTVTVELAVADSNDRMMKIGMIQINRKNVVNRSSFSG
jgi:hypothetical protein